MSGPMILPAIFLVLPPTILLMAQASAGTPAAADCSTRPGSSAPQGTHWSPVALAWGQIGGRPCMHFVEGRIGKSAKYQEASL